MTKVTLTLNLTYQQATKVLALLNTSPESCTEPTSPKLSLEIQSPSEDLSELVEPPRSHLQQHADMKLGRTTIEVKPTASPKGNKAKPRMASFGRTQAQIDEYESSEESRIELLDEKEEIRTTKLADKQAIEAKQTEEVKAIKAQPTPTIAKLPKKPWEL